jgi:spermidine synthase
MDINKDSDNWTNDAAKNYYSHVSIAEVQSVAKSSGLDDGCDVDLIMEYVKNPNSILEAGGGYGRVVNKLLERKYGEQIFTIERDAHFLKYLKSLFKNTDRVEICEGDIRTYNFGKIKFDLVTVMWSQISEYPKIEQKKVLVRLKSLLTPNGTLVVETIDHTTRPKAASYFENQTYAIEFNDVTIYGYVPSPEEMKKYSLEIGFSNFIEVPYTTKTDLKRMIYIMRL